MNVKDRVQVLYFDRYSAFLECTALIICYHSSQCSFLTKYTGSSLKQAMSYDN